MFLTARNRLISLISKTVVDVLYKSSSHSLNNISKLQISKHSVRFKYGSYNKLKVEVPKGSRYAPPSQIEVIESYISSALKNKTAMSDEEWKSFKLDLLDKNEFISEETFSSIVMNSLLASNQLDLSHSFLKFVEKSAIKPNFLTYLKYISLCSKNYRHVDQEHILKIVQKVKNTIDASPVLDMKRAEYIIQGLCATDRWEESFQYLNKLVSKKPSTIICNALACAAMRNDEQRLAWEILTKWMNPYDTISDSVIEEFMLCALLKQKTSPFESDKFVEKLFHFMQERDVIMSIDVAKIVEEYFKMHPMKWNVTYTKVARIGECEACRNQLKLLKFKDQDFEDLREAFLRHAVMKSDIYINTNARELRNYMQFVEAHKPFHIVLDGLNAAYTYKGINSRKNLSTQLYKIVKKLSGKSRKLLVLGRKHMKSWSAIQNFYGNTKLFFTDNISEDDPFVIYAALASGPHTLFLSGDLMRDHLSRLDDPRLIHLFKRWQLSHQMFIETDNLNNINFIEPVRHSITVQGSMSSGWHIPFDDKIILDPYEELNNWLCIQKCI